MSNLVVGSTLKEFFRMLVGEVVSRQKVSLAEVTEFYVVNLLSDRKSTRLNSSHIQKSRMPSSA